MATLPANRPSIKPAHRGGASFKSRETKRGPRCKRGRRGARLHLSRSAIFAGNSTRRPRPSRGLIMAPLCTTFSVGSARSNKRGPACAAGPRSCFWRIVLGYAYPASMVRPWGRARLCARDRSGGLLALAFHSFPLVPDARQDTTGKSVWMAAEWWASFRPISCPPPQESPSICTKNCD
jgi:hypothetical protein